MNFEEIVQKVVNAEAKVDLRSSTMVQNLDICYPQGHRPSNSIASKVQTQETTAKKPRPKKSKPKEAKLAKKKAFALPWINMVESLEQGKKNRKKKKQRF